MHYYQPRILLMGDSGALRECAKRGSLMELMTVRVRQFSDRLPI